MGDDGVWKAKKITTGASEFQVYLNDEFVGEVRWKLVGEHHIHNALMSIAAARHVAVPAEEACRRLGGFINARRRLELRGTVNNISV